MKNCEGIEEQLTAGVLGLLDEPERQRLERHLAGCAPCRRLGRESEALQKHMLALSAERVPGPVREALLSRIHTALQREAQRAPSPGRVAAAVGAGIGGVLLYLLILWQRADLNALPSAQLLLVAAAWMGLMACACSWALGRYRLRRLDLRFGALFGLLSSLLAGAGILLCPQETYFALWERSGLSGAATGMMGAPGSYALFGLLYALPPALIAAAALRRPAERPAGSGLLAAGMGVALWLPAAYLQCSALALTVFLAWAGGALLGMLGGFWGGVGLRCLGPAWLRAG